MTIKIAADIHGAYDELHQLLSPSDTLFLLGDFLNVLDYDDYSGMISEFIAIDVIKQVLELIEARQLDEAKVLMAKYSLGQSDLFGKLAKLAGDHYEALFSGLPCETFLIWGNVDFPGVLKKHLKPNTHLIENSVVDIGGRKCGFVTGSPHMRYSFGMPGELTREEYRNRLYGLGPVDHLFVHPPPAITDLAYDEAANRDEEGSVDLLTYIDAYFPKTVYFGHVHRPRVSNMMYKNKTELINVGFFRQTHKLIEF